jgi:hypothetical protein
MAICTSAGLDEARIHWTHFIQVQRSFAKITRQAMRFFPTTIEAPNSQRDAVQSHYMALRDIRMHQG